MKTIGRLTFLIVAVLSCAGALPARAGGDPGLSWTFCDASEAECVLTVSLNFGSLIDHQARKLYLRHQRTPGELQLPFYSVAKWMESITYNPGGGPGYVDIARCEITFSIGKEKMDARWKTSSSGHSGSVSHSGDFEVSVRERSRVQLSDATLEVSWSEIDKRANQALLPTTTAVTPPAAQEPRQP